MRVSTPSYIYSNKSDTTANLKKALNKESVVCNPFGFDLAAILSPDELMV
jgi:hypothetical protein